MDLRLPFRSGAGRTRITIPLVAGLTLGMLFGIWQLLELRMEVDSALNELHEAQSDNRTWTISQAETDLMRYRLALAQARATPSPNATDVLRRQFDIFYSRVLTIQSTLATEHFLDEPDLLKAWDGVLKTAEEGAAVFDAGDVAVAHQLSQLEAAAEQVAPEVRAIVVEALQHITDDSMALREGTRDLLDNFFSWTAVMIGILIAFAVGVLMLLYWIARYARLKTHLSARQTKVINASIDAVLICDVSGNILEFNSTAGKMFGLSSGVEDQLRLDRLFVPGHPGHGDDEGENSAPPVAHWHRLAQTTATVTSAVQRADGATRPVECVFSVDTEIEGGTIFIVFVRDISKQIEHERRLETARDAAEQGERAKSRFLAVMSHEMRTPLNGLIAALEILRQTTRLSQRQEKFLTIAEQCGKTTLAQIDDVLELIRLDSEAPDEEFQNFDLLALLSSLVEQYRPMATLQRNVIDIEIPDEHDLWVLGPRRTMERVVLNLLGNAIKFTQDGNIRLSLAADMSEPGIVSFTLGVSDTGRGITSEKLDVIFRDFETDATPGQPVAQGTGLGLGIVRRAIDRLGGTVGVTSTLGKGSTFTVRFKLPRGSALRAYPEPSYASAASGRKNHVRLDELAVLIAEDNEINRQVLSEMLRHQGARVDIATDGEEAVLLAEKRRYDLVIMDLSMPKLDGIDATRLIRSGGASTKSCIVGLTAHAGGEQQRVMQAAGMAAVVTKPVTFEKLRYLLSTVTAGGGEKILPRVGALLEPIALGDLKRSFTADRLRVLLKRFEEDTDSAFRQMEADQMDADMLHRLSGSAAVFGAEAFRKLLIDIEDLIRAGKRVSPTSLAELRACWQATIADLRVWLDSSAPKAPSGPPIL